MGSIRAFALLVTTALLACARGAPDLPEGWAGAKSIVVSQSECTGSALPMAPPETVQVRAWGPPAEVAYHDAHFRCAQKVCAYRRDDSAATAVLVQPCDMDPGSVAKCDCLYDIGFSVPGPRDIIEVHRRWDNINHPNPPVLVGRVARAGGTGCTAIGCGPAFEVAFAAGADWSPGVYRIEVDADGAVGACDVTLPLSCQGSSVCTGTRAWVAIESGCALPSAQQAIGGIQFGSATPAHVDVTVSRAGRPLGAGTFTPEYRTSMPNGPACEPTCRAAMGAALMIEL